VVSNNKDNGYEHGEYGKNMKRIMFEDTDHRQAKLFVKIKGQGMTQAAFFRHIVTGYLNDDERLVSYIDEVKKQSKPRKEKTKSLRDTGKKNVSDLALNDGEINNIFDLLAEEHPDL
jgi:hypothetical protein